MPFLAMRKIPAVKAIVMVIGSFSGIADAVKATDVVIISVIGIPLNNPVINTTAQQPKHLHKLLANFGHLVLERGKIIIIF